MRFVEGRGEVDCSCRAPAKVATAPPSCFLLLRFVLDTPPCSQSLLGTQTPPSSSLPAPALLPSSASSRATSSQLTAVKISSIRVGRTKATALDKVGDSGEVLSALATAGKVEDSCRVISTKSAIGGAESSAAWGGRG